ncbi:hypothetical protein HN937_20335, partial [Candidatus Poribacteria bacterium]|nr:hypothetical protein [Candidatus Poribacteria bacterium]
MASRDGARPLLLLIDGRVADAIGRSASDIHVYGDVRLDRAIELVATHSDSAAARLYKHILRDAIGLEPDQRLRFILNADPDSESSRGSTHPGTHLDVAAGHDFWPLARGTFDPGGATQPATADLAPEDVFGGKVEVREGVDELRRFVGKYNEYAAGRESRTDPAPTGIDDPYPYGEVFTNTYGRAKKLARQAVRGDNAGQILVEPIFIL